MKKRFLSLTGTWSDGFSLDDALDPARRPMLMEQMDKEKKKLDDRASRLLLIMGVWLGWHILQLLSTSYRIAQDPNAFELPFDIGNFGFIIVAAGYFEFRSQSVIRGCMRSRSV